MLCIIRSNLMTGEQNIGQEACLIGVWKRTGHVFTQRIKRTHTICPFIIPLKVLVICFLQVSTNGAISFGQAFLNSNPEVFPSSSGEVFWSYLAAPFWADISTTQSGSVSWEIHENLESPDLLAQVDNLIQQEYGDLNFNGLWMLIGFWENVQFTDQQDTVNNALYIY